MRDFFAVELVFLFEIAKPMLFDAQISGSGRSVASVLFPDGQHDRLFDLIHQRGKIVHLIQIRHRRVLANRALELNYVHAGMIDRIGVKFQVSDSRSEVSGS